MLEFANRAGNMSIKDMTVCVSIENSLSLISDFECYVLGKDVVQVRK